MSSNQGKTGSNIDRENNGEVDSCITSAKTDKNKGSHKEKGNEVIASKASFAQAHLM